MKWKGRRRKLIFLSAYYDPLLEKKNLRTRKGAWPLEDHVAQWTEQNLNIDINLRDGFYFGGLRDGKDV